MKLQTINKPFNFILFGASGDLAQLKLFPSLYELVLQKRFAKKYTIVGFARSEMTDDEFRILEKQNLMRALARSNWRISGAGGAADLLELKPSTLSYRMKMLGIKKPGQS